MANASSWKAIKLYKPSYINIMWYKADLDDTIICMIENLGKHNITIICLHRPAKSHTVYCRGGTHDDFATNLTVSRFVN